MNLLAEFVSSMTLIISKELFPGSPSSWSEELDTTQNPSTEIALTTCYDPLKTTGVATVPVVGFIDER